MGCSFIVRSFSYEPFKVVYKKGRLIPVLDTLSRFTPVHSEDHISLLSIDVNMIKTQLVMRADFHKSLSNTLDRIKKSTRNDDKLTLLSRYISEGILNAKCNLSQKFTLTLL